MRHLHPHSLAARLVAPAGLAVALGGPWFVSCASKPQIDVAVLDPNGFRAGAAWAQLVIYPETCPTDDSLEAGDVTSNVKLYSVPAAQGFPTIGDLDKAKFGFAVILRDDTCGVTAFGCTPVDLEHHRHITILLNDHKSDSTPVDPGKARCDASAGQKCDQGLCTGGEPSDGGTDAPNDQHTPEAGGTCNLQLVGAANFDDPIAAGAAFAGPTVVATPKGFVVVYREVDSTGSNARAVRQFVGDDGTKGVRSNSTVKGCAGQLGSDGVAATWSASQAAGFMVVAAPACNTDAPEAYVANFDQDGQVLADVSYPLPEEITLANVEAAAAYPTSTQYMLAAVSTGSSGPSPVLYTFDGVSVNANFAAIQNGGGIPTFAHVAAASGIVATLADSDLNGGQTALSVQPPGSGVIATSFLTQGAFATLAVWGSRALAAIPSSTGMDWNLVDASGDPVANGKLSGGPFGSIDSAALNDHVLLAGGATSKITVFRMDDASGTLSGGAALQTALTSSLGSATLANYDGGRVSIAAARNRVVIAWLNSEAPVADATTAPGGFAVLTCDN